MSSEASSTKTGGLSGLMSRVRANPMVPLLIAGAAAVAILVVLFLWARTPDYRVLFSNLSDSDGGTVIARLDQMQVPYRFAEGGQAILVPAGQVEQTRMALATEGLPQGGGVGFELMDEQSFGISQFAERINYQRALEGELARSIESIEAVQSARIHLALPQESVFVRDRREPSASVVLTLYRNRAVSDGQVNAIAHLVSSSVSDLPASQVTVVDQDGELLSNSSDNSSRQFNANQLEYANRIEEAYSNRIERLLSTIVGHNNVQAQINASIDFSVSEHTQETFDPNQDPNEATVRSIQSSESEQIGMGGVGGVPGALSNTPPANAEAPLVEADAVDPDDPAADGEEEAVEGEDDNQNQTVAPASSSASASSTTNYEVNRTIRHVQEETGRIERLSIAVVVDYAQQVNEEGEVERVPLSEEQMAQIRSLVQESVGFSQARGDSLEVVNTAFSQEAVEQAPEIPWYKDPDLIALGMTLLRYLVIAIVALLLWRKLLKPLLARQRGESDAGRDGERGERGELLATAGDDDDEAYEQSEDDLAAEIRKKHLKRQRVEHEHLLSATREQSKKDPRMVAMILRGWINGKD